MNLILVILINILIIFIVFVLLNSKIKKNSAPRLLESYTREVENLIVELNRAVDNAVNLSEERVNELKRCIRKAERLLKDPGFQKLAASKKKKVESRKKEENKAIGDQRKNLLDKTRHLITMGYSSDDIAKLLNISRQEVEFLEALNRD